MMDAPWKQAIAHRPAVTPATTWVADTGAASMRATTPDTTPASVTTHQVSACVPSKGMA